VEVAGSDGDGDGDGDGGGGEGGESAEVGWRSARARAESVRALCTLMRALRLWAGAGEGSDAGADAAERARQLTAAFAAREWQATSSTAQRPALPEGAPICS
jgi:hypothetical protein